VLFQENRWKRLTGKEEGGRDLSRRTRLAAPPGKVKNC